jgi:transcriptional regulator with XRE-family HTH domain
MSVVGDNIRMIREQQGYSMNALAKKAGIAYATLNAIERSTKSPSIDTISLLSEALNIPISYLLGEKQESAFTAQEKKLVDDFRSLNQQGRDYVLQTMAMAVRIYLSRQSDSVSNVENRAE